jgi:hypothetical protein
MFKAFLEEPEGRGWYLFDAIRMSAPDGIVRIGVGRDAAEVDFCTPYGEVEAASPEVWIEPLATSPGQITTMAVRAQISFPARPA